MEGWWSTFFDAAALDLWRRAHSDDDNRAQAAAIADALGLARAERVLDVPCGDARIALELAAGGARVSGLDACAEAVLEGLRCAARRGLELDLRTGDMRALPWGAGEFDAAFCAGNSFGYFDEDGNLAFLRAVAHSLRSGGRFLLEYPLVAELLLAQRALRHWRLLGERLLLTEARYDPARRRLESLYTLADVTRASETLETRAASFRVYSVRELEALLAQAGFTRTESLGDLEGSRFGPAAVEFHVRAVRA